MYEIARYTDVNNLGTAVLLEELSKRPVERLIVASSMSIYGEGLYKCADGTVCDGVERGIEQLKACEWELCSPKGEKLTPIPTPETKTPTISSVYALSKFDQEKLCLMVGRAYGISTVALRFFNVFGTRQALSNPYTGVLAIFASQYLNNKRPIVFEDGNQSRDFVSVLDVARACRLAMEIPEADGGVFNIGRGRHNTVRDIANLLAVSLGKGNLEPEIVGKYRVGDIRHCFADISRARHTLGYEPAVSIETGLIDLASWLETQSASDRVKEASQELAARGLVV